MLQETGQTLRTGQIIQGRIVKLYPNNKANIQLGTNKLIAQLEASLAVGENYHFQVQSSEDMIHLRVLGDALTYKNQANLLELLQHLGIKATKVNQDFVRSLLEKKIPFDKSQLHRAIVLLEGASDRGQAQNVLHDMMVRRFPIKTSIFLALQERLSSSFSERIGALNHDAISSSSSQNHLQSRLLEQLHRLLSPDKIVPNLKAIAENQELFHLMKSVQIIDQDSRFMDWGNRVKNALSGNLSEINQLVNLDKLQNLYTIDSIRKNVVSILNRFGEALQSSIAKKIPLAPEVFASLIKEVDQKVFQPLQNKNNLIVNNPQQLHYLLRELEILVNSQGLDRFTHQFIKDIFAKQARNVLQNVGLQYEKAILHDENNPATSLKAILLSLVQSSDGFIQDQANKLLHFVNGMQLQSVQETDKFIQANLLVPAIKLGLKSDVELNFEGKKNDNGVIDPNFCRVIFYLDLATIKKTVVDMHVQKRAISLTILNDNPLENIMKPLQSLLKEGLEKINYHLSSVSHRPLKSQELDHSKNKFIYHNQYSTYQGVDLRI